MRPPSQGAGCASGGNDDINAEGNQFGRESGVPLELPLEEHAATQHRQSIRACLGDFREGPVDILWPSRLDDV
jgi:hypothetical protein